MQKWLSLEQAVESLTSQTNKKHALVVLASPSPDALLFRSWLHLCQAEHNVVVSLLLICVSGEPTMTHMHLLGEQMDCWVHKHEAHAPVHTLCST